MTLDEAAARLSQLAGRPIRPFSTRDFGREQNPAGRSVVVEHNKARQFVTVLRNEVGPGLVAFIGCTRSLAEGAGDGSEVVVAPGENQFDILRVAQSDAINFGLETEDLIPKLQEWDQAFGIDIVHAETDTIEFVVKTPPQDIARFCQALYDFCPDIVDQGCGSVEQLQIEVEKAIAKRTPIMLWWD